MKEPIYILILVLFAGYIFCLAMWPLISLCSTFVIGLVIYLFLISKYPIDEQNKNYNNEIKKRER